MMTIFTDSETMQIMGRADALELRAEAAESRCTDLLEKNSEQAEAITILRAERDRLLVDVQLMKYLPIPTIAEIYPHPDPVYGHCFKWPKAEVDQFMEMLPE